jgi:DNA-binding MarR family transcriptional regulator
VADQDHVSYVLAQWRHELPRLDRTAFAVVGRISRLALLLDGRLDEVFAAGGLTGGEFDVLAALRRAGRPYRMTPTALSRQLIVTSGGLTRRLHSLEGRGLVARERDNADGRSTTVSLTAEGKRLVEAVLAQHIQNEERLIGALSPADRRQLAALLQRLAVSLGDVAPGPGTREARASAVAAKAKLPRR